VVVQYPILCEHFFINTGRNPKRRAFAVLTAERFASAKKVESAERCVHTHHLAGIMCYVSWKDEYLFCLWLFKGRISRVTSGDLLYPPDGLLHAGAWPRKSRNTRIGVMEIAGLDVQISMSGHPVLHMWHPFNSTHGGTWSRPVADTTGNITVPHWRCCSHMEQTRNHTEDNTCRFKMSMLVHS
jgi:hypothetical protein